MATPLCRVSLLSGKSAALPLLGTNGLVDLPDFLLRSLACLLEDSDGAGTALGRLPLPLLNLADNDGASPGFGKLVDSTEALASYAEREGPLEFTLSGRAMDAEEADSCVRRCRAGLTRLSQLHDNTEGYHFSYPVAYMLLNRRTVSFPEFSGISVNMMPFVMGDKTSLPEHLHGYWPLLEACRLAKEDPEEQGKVGFLTVDEREILEEGGTHRRPGLHTDSPGVHLPGAKPGSRTPAAYVSRAEERWDAFRRGELAEDPGHPAFVGNERVAQGQKAFHARGCGDFSVRYHAWGIGMVMGKERRGGIYMASNVEGSVRIFNALVQDPRMIGHLGSCEHLRDFLGPGEALPANELCWFTDRTPHESLPLAKGTRRQFFRLVTSDVGVWYPEHSTANPTGTAPNGKVTQLLPGSKFRR